jgi:hypothetical protein
MADVKIVRLQNGEDIISECQEDVNGYYTLINPFVIFTKRMDGVKTSVFLTPWLPIDIIEENIARVFVSDVVFTMIPTSDMVEYYDKTVNDILFEDEFADMPSDSDGMEIELELEDGIIEDEIHVIKTKKTLH